MKIDRNELLDKINIIKQQAFGVKNIFEYNNTFIFNGKNVCAYTDKCFVAVEYETDFKAIVPGKEFLKILENIKSNKINIKEKETILTITGRNTEIELKCLDLSFSLIEKMFTFITKKWKKLPENFKEGLSLNVFCTSNDITRPELTCVHIKDNIIEASDNYRISSYNMNEKITQEMFLPNDNVISFLSFANEFVLYQKTDNWVFFSNKEKNIIFGMRDYSGNFPDTAKFFDIKGKKIKLPDTIESNIDLVSILAEGDYDLDKRIEIEIKDQTLFCRTSHDKGTIKTKINIDSKQKIKFEINPMFLQRILKKTKTFIYNDSFVKFIDKDYQHIISLYVKGE